MGMRRVIRGNRTTAIVGGGGRSRSAPEKVCGVERRGVECGDGIYVWLLRTHWEMDGNITFFASNRKCVFILLM